MAAGKYDCLVIRCAKAGDDAIGAHADVGWLLAVRAPVPEQEPAGALAEDFTGLMPFVVAVVPFEEVGIDRRGLTESSERASARRTLKRTREDPVKRNALKTLAEPSRFAFALFRQRNVGAASMLAACAPFGFAMADEIDARKHGDSDPASSPQTGAEDPNILPVQDHLGNERSQTDGENDAEFG